MCLSNVGDDTTTSSGRTVRSDSGGSTRRATDPFRRDAPPSPGAGPCDRVVLWEKLTRVCAFAGTLAAGLMVVRIAWAHALAQRYYLPAPLWLYLSGVGAAVVISFAALAGFGRRRLVRRPGFRVALLRTPVGRLLAHPYLLTTSRVLSVGVFVLAVAAGFFGDQNPFRNPAPVLVWDFWWTGMVLVSAFLGNLWSLVNPWKIIFSWVRALYLRARPDGGSRPHLPYPERLGAWPAVVLFLVFAWMALVWRGTAAPVDLASAVALYSLVAWLGMAVFGKDTWLRRGEVFTVVFTLLAAFAPTEARLHEPRSEKGPEWNLRLPAVGLLAGRPLHPSLMVLILLVLAEAVFQSLGDTPVWSGIMDWVVGDSTLWPLWSALERLGLSLFAAVQTVAWVLFAALFVGTYLMIGGVVAWAGGGRVSTGEVACRFARSLVPVALAYYVAHGFVHLPAAARSLIALVSDPFGIGWDLFESRAGWGMVGTVDAGLVWYVTLGAVAAGHVLAVWLALATASRVFPDARVALKSQYPMVVFLAAHAATSLWMLSQPVYGNASG